MAHRLISHFARKFHRGLVPALMSVALSVAVAQSAFVEHSSTASPKEGGWYPWYELASDPTDASHLILCGMRWDAMKNAFYGFLYSSQDSGSTWRVALEDKNSDWVSEQSCAFGSHGNAFFVSEASRVIDGKPHHDLGTTRIFRSKDSGETWVEAATTEWADYSTSVVNTQPGPFHNRLYTFFNDFYFPHPDKTTNAANTRVSALTFDDLGTTAQIPRAVSKTRYLGSYPQRAFIFDDGSLLALYFGALKRKGKTYEVLGAAHASADLSRLEDSVVVQVPRDQLNDCYPEEFAATYEPARNAVLLAYPSWVGGECRLLLRQATANGKKWTKPRAIPRPVSRSGRFFSPALAVNSDGIVGLLWRDEPLSDCWYFATSLDMGRTFARPTAVSNCSTKQPQNITTFGASLRTSTDIIVNRDSTTMRLQVVDSRNHTWKSLGALATTRDGLFHAAWVEKNGDKGELRTAALRVVGNAEPKERGKFDVTNALIPLYAGSQRYNPLENTLTVEIKLRNRSEASLRSPLVLSALQLTSGLGDLETLNSSNKLSNIGASWDVSRFLPNGVLPPGSTTDAFPIVFQLPNATLPSGEVQVFSLEFKAWAGDQ